MARLAEYMRGFPPPRYDSQIGPRRHRVRFAVRRRAALDRSWCRKSEAQDELIRCGKGIRGTSHLSTISASAPQGCGRSIRSTVLTKCGRLLDNARGRCLSHLESHKVIEFPGRLKRQYPLIGPISEMGTLDGVPVQIDGQDDPCWLHLEDVDGIVRICGIKRSDAIKMRDCLYEKSIRVKGLGRWHRDVEGKWVMRSFSCP